MLEVLAPAQREVGRRWEDGRWSVAQEHAATAVTDTALGLLALDAEAGGEGHAVVACVEDEWHSMPARMAAEILRVRGWEVTFLGPSLPADELARYVESQHPDVVGLSCSMPVSLKGAARSIDACRRVGVPVLAGGSGFGPDGRYAGRLGATAWAPDPAVAVSIVESWLNEAPSIPPAPAPVSDAHLALECERDAIVSAAVADLGCDSPSAREALTFLVGALETSLFLGEAALMAACQPAAERLLVGHPDPPPVSSAVDALLTAVERVLPGEKVVDETRRVARLGGAGFG